jgi:flagellar protein FlgJ
MTQGIKFQGPSFPPSIQVRENMRQGRDAGSAPTSPNHAVPVIDRSKVDPKVLEAAEGMEAMFIDYMMKVMRETVPKNEMDLESPASQIYRGMQDSEYAQKAAHHGGVGLADQVIAYLGTPGYPVIEGRATSSKEKP